MRRRLRDERGATAVEFAMIVPLLLVLVLGIAEFGHAFQVQGTLSAAAREGARVMALQNDPAAARAAVRDATPHARPGDHERADHRDAGRLPDDEHHHVERASDRRLPDAVPHRLLRRERRPHRDGGHAVQRLTSRVRRRLAGEHGASAVLLALLLVPILGFTAIAVDVGALYAEQARLQVAADSAALAVAADCAKGACGDMQATAQGMVDANLGDATAAPPVLASN